MPRYSKITFFLTISLFSFSNLFGQLIPVLKHNILEMSLNPFFNTPDQYNLAAEISNKGNTTDLSLRELYWNTYQQDSDLEKIIKTQLPNGSWGDIDYKDDARSNWQPTNHVSRLLYLSRAYITPASKFYHQKSVSTVLHNGLNFWFKTQPICLNWWYNQIGIPRLMGLVFVFLQNELSPDELTEAVKVMNNANFGMTGQNKVWLAGNVLLKAILTHDTKLAQASRDTISSEIFIGTEEGIQPDYSFHQHGPQQQFGNYGLSFLSSMAYYANIFTGTPLAFSPKPMDILRNYTTEGENWVVWRGYMDVNACGRQFFKQAQAGKALAFCISVYQLKQADSAYSKVYDNILKRNMQPGTVPEKKMAKHFPNSDLTVFRSPNSYISVRACSPRVKGTEFTNNENKKGHFIADGSNFFLRRGDEYVDIFPIWDWNRLPGITAPILDSIVPRTKTDDYKNPNPFVGGLTHKGTGISTFHLARNGVDAKKSWFYLDNVLVCLGTDIKSNSGKDIITGLNQCLQKGNATLTYQNGKSFVLNDTLLNSQEIQSVWHDSIGYYFSQSQSCSFSLKTQNGNWHAIADPYSKESVSAKVFKLWLDHGKDAVNSDSYEYMVLPSVSVSDLKTFIHKPEIEILANNSDIQSVKLKNDSLYEFVFYKQKRVELFTKKGFIESKTPGLVMLQLNSNQSLTLSVADPTQLQKSFNLVLSGNYSGKFARYNSKMKVTEIEIPLPKGGFAGSSVQVELQRN